MVLTTLGVLSLITTTALAGQMPATPEWLVPGLPLLLAKSWLLGYALVFLAVLLGLLAVLIPSMRKTLRKR